MKKVYSHFFKQVMTYDELYERASDYYLESGMFLEPDSDFDSLLDYDEID